MKQLLNRAKASPLMSFDVQHALPGEGNRSAYWQGIMHRIDKVLKAELTRCQNEAGNMTADNFLSYRDPRTNQCTIYIRNISLSVRDGIHDFIEEMQKVPIREFSVTRLYDIQRKSYTACIQASSPEKLLEGLNGFCRQDESINSFIQQPTSH